jgi:hypothetical protein
MADKKITDIRSDVQNKIDDLKNIDAQAELEKLKNKALDVNSHVDTAKAKGNAVMEKVKELGIGGLAVILLSILAQLLFPWWVVPIVGFWVGFWVYDSPQRSFLYGFGGMFLVWSIYAGIQSSANGALMSSTISNVFGGKLSATQLIYATGTIGGLVCGLAAMTGTYCRHLSGRVGASESN